MRSASGYLKVYNAGFEGILRREFMPREKEGKRSERTRYDSELQWRRTVEKVSAEDIRRLVAKLKGEESKK